MRFIGKGKKHKNRKIGKKIFYTYGTKDTCPAGCPLLLNGACYGRSGRTNLAFDKSYNKNTIESFYTFMAELPEGATVRHHITGDFGINGKLNFPYITAFILAHYARPDLKAFFYTHMWREFKNNPFKCLPNVNSIASCETMDDIKEAKARGWNVATVVKENSTPKTMPIGIKICIHALTGGKVTCSDCMLCAKKTMPVIAFPLHGSTRRNFEATI